MCLPTFHLHDIPTERCDFAATRKGVERRGNDNGRSVAGEEVFRGFLTFLLTDF